LGHSGREGADGECAGGGQRARSPPATPRAAPRPPAPPRRRAPRAARLQLGQKAAEQRALVGLRHDHAAAVEAAARRRVVGGDGRLVAFRGGTGGVWGFGGTEGGEGSDREGELSEGAPPRGAPPGGGRGGRAAAGMPGAQAGLPPAGARPRPRAARLPPPASGRAPCGSPHALPGAAPAGQGRPSSFRATLKFLSSRGLLQSSRGMGVSGATPARWTWGGECVRACCVRVCVPQDLGGLVCGCGQGRLCSTSPQNAHTQTHPSAPRWPPGSPTAASGGWCAAAASARRPSAAAAAATRASRRRPRACRRAAPWGRAAPPPACTTTPGEGGVSEFQLNLYFKNEGLDPRKPSSGGPPAARAGKGRGRGRGERVGSGGGGAGGRTMADPSLRRGD
jgi:hypothetical protein